VAASPLCHRAQLFERSPGNHWLATSEGLYQLVLSPDGLVVGARSREKPCLEFHDLLQTVGVTAKVKNEYQEGEGAMVDWDTIAEQYGIRPVPEVHRVTASHPELKPVEEEMLRAIQLLGAGDGWVQVELFAHGFATNFNATLKSLARKGMIAFSSKKEVRIL
jgi:hypothetical protein